MSIPPEPRPPYQTDPYAADPRAVAATYGSLESLRTALTVVGLIAIIAAGLAVWALLRPHHGRTIIHQAPANTAAIATLTARVNHLDATVRSLRSSGGTQGANTQSLATRNAAQVSQLASKEAALSAKVSQLTGKEAALSGQVSQLQGRVASLSGQVSQIKAQTTSRTTTTGTSTGP